MTPGLDDWRVDGPRPRLAAVRPVLLALRGFYGGFSSRPRTAGSGGVPEMKKAPAEAGAVGLGRGLLLRLRRGREVRQVEGIGLPLQAQGLRLGLRPAGREEGLLDLLDGLPGLPEVRDLDGGAAGALALLPLLVEGEEGGRRHDPAALRRVAEDQRFDGVLPVGLPRGHEAGRNALRRPLRLLRGGGRSLGRGRGGSGRDGFGRGGRSLGGGVLDRLRAHLDSPSGRSLTPAPSAEPISATPERSAEASFRARGQSKNPGRSLRAKELLGERSWWPLNRIGRVSGAKGVTCGADEPDAGPPPSTPQKGGPPSVPLHPSSNHASKPTKFSLPLLLILIPLNTTAQELPAAPRAYITIRPQISLPPAYVNGVAKVYDPQCELRCPKFAWEWGDLTRSVWEPDCDDQPVSRGTSGRVWIVWTNRPHIYRHPGTYEVRFTATWGEGSDRRVITSAPTTVRVAAPDHRTLNARQTQ